MILKKLFGSPGGIYSGFFDQNNQKLIKIWINTVARGKWCSDGAVHSFLRSLSAQRDDVIYARPGSERVFVYISFSSAFTLTVS